MRRIIPVLVCLIALSVVLAGCGSTNGGVSPSPSSSETSASPSASPSPSPSAIPSPDGFVMGKVTSKSGSTIRLDVVKHDGGATTNAEQTINVDGSTSYAVSGSLKTATIADIAVGDVISASLSGTTALKIIDNGPDVDPDPSAYISPSPSPSPSDASASPSANS